jgi:hypothetical protein
LVESFIPESSSGLHGKVHIRPCADQVYPADMHVECAKELSKGFPVATRFKIRAKLTDREGKGDFLYSYFGWPYEVLDRHSDSTEK